MAGRPLAWLMFMSRAGYLARQIGGILTSSLGIEVEIEEAKPNWKDRTVLFKNVRARRMFDHVDASDSSVDTNVSKFDVVIEQVEVKLSVPHFSEGNGLVTELKVRGVRGDVLRDHIRWDLPYLHTVKGQRGFDFTHVLVEDVLVKVHDVGRQYSVSVLTLDLDRLRYQFFLQDLMRARLAIGSFDDCLFSVHAHQQLQQSDMQRIVRTHFSRASPRAARAHCARFPSGRRT